MSRAYLELSEGPPPGAVTVNPAPPAGGRAPGRTITASNPWVPEAGGSAKLAAP